VRFVDSSFWIALQIREDQHHLAARRLWIVERQSLVTTNHVIGESWTFLRRRQEFAVARRFVDTIKRSRRTTILRVDETAEAAAWAWLRRHDERVYSFVDATSFAVMRQLGSTEALAFDGDFSAAGFVELRP
jgi:predicted nucleic acid-binding protein